MNRVNVALVKKEPCFITPLQCSCIQQTDGYDLVDTVCLGFHKASKLPHQEFHKETKSQFHNKEGHLTLK